MGGLLTAAVSAASIFASRASALAEDSKNPKKMTLHGWVLTRLLGEARRNAGLWEKAGAGPAPLGARKLGHDLWKEPAPGRGGSDVGHQYPAAWGRS